MRTPMSEIAFKRMLAPFVRQGIPFLAYWHPAGMGLIRLDYAPLWALLGLFFERAALFLAEKGVG